MSRFSGLVVLSLFLASPARADTTLTFDGDVPAEGSFFVIPFDVPAGTVEIEIRHDDLSDMNILDWGVLDPGGFRGYGGGNTEPAVFNADAASRSYLPGAITPGAWQVYVGKAKIRETPAHYHVEVVLRDAITLAAQPERTPYVASPALSSEARWYAGDFHVHSRESGDASPTLEEVADYAEMVGLDFVMLSEHNTISQLELYAEVQAAHPDLLFIPGVEVTTYQGHAMAMGATEWIDHRLETGGLTMLNVADAAHAQSAVFSINHPALSIGDACIGCGWMAELGGENVDAMEIQTGAYSVTGRLFYPHTSEMWEDFIAAGHHVVAVGGSDDHRAGTGTGAFDSPIGSPTTMVWADELSAAAILEGVRRGRTVVKLQDGNDPMLELECDDLDPSVTDTIVEDVTTLRVRVTGAAMGTTVRIVHNGEPGAPVDVVGALFEHEFRVIAGGGEDAYRAELVVLGAPRVVTNHVYLRPITPGGPDADLDPDAGAIDASASDAGATTPPASGCGCRVGAARAPSAPALLLALATLACRARTRRRGPRPSLRG
jgi:hypothetical protein